MQDILGQKKNVRKIHVRWMVRYAPSVLACRSPVVIVFLHIEHLASLVVLRTLTWNV